MAPLSFTLENGRTLQVIPDSRVHMDGHPIITCDYNIYVDGDQRQDKDDLIETPKSGPDYLGYITVDVPGRVFTYTSGSGAVLNVNEVEEVVEHINEMRDNPNLWGMDEG